MTNNAEEDRDQLDKKTLDIKQALKYAKDLAWIYQEEKSKRKALEVANEKIHAVLDSMSDGVIATNNAYVIIQTNQVICRFLEKQKEELIGQNLLKIVDTPELKERLQKLKTSTEDWDRFELEQDLSTKRVLRLSVSMIDKDKGYVMVFHDITAEKRAENLKNEFLSILSHELRTPLNAILGFSSLLADELAGKIDPDDLKMLESIGESGQRLFNIVEELLVFAQIKSQDLESLDSNVRVDDVLNFILPELKIESDKKDIMINLETLIEGAIVTGNESMLKSLFTHVVQNAVIFGKQGGYIRIRLNDKGDNYEISVSDNGIGIPPGDVENVFKSFYQVQEHMTRNHGGLGLGLAMARHIVELHGGVIKIESKLNEGTTLFIRLPKASDS